MTCWASLEEFESLGETLAWAVEPGIDVALAEARRDREWSYPVILPPMKTAISVPDDTYARVERAAREHGMNRSEFYSRAAERYVAHLESTDVTAAIDVVADAVNADESSRFAVAAGSATLGADDDAW